MPSQVVIVHQNRELIEQAASRLRQDGYTVATFHDSMTALGALEAARTVELLITGIDFGSGTLTDSRWLAWRDSRDLTSAYCLPRGPISGSKLPGLASS
jgi:hypothetical protein